VKVDGRSFRARILFCLPTHSENFGLAVLEACQVGTPVLTTTGTPWVEDLGNGTGYISEPTAESIRETLARYFARERHSPAERQALSDWAWGSSTGRPSRRNIPRFIRPSSRRLRNDR
jgi:glycosyltransferase involved in cell wall biosynthesis